MDFEGISYINTDNNFGLKSKENIYSEMFYFTDFYDERETKNFIKNIERIIRGSREYSNYIEQLRTNFQGLNNDVILSNISTLDTDLEFHHYPFSLYDIVEIVITDSASRSEFESTLSAAKKVMDLHYKNMIGLVPLTVTNHQLAHSGDLFISTKQIFGDWESFENKYANSISPEMKNKLADLREKSENNLPSDYKELF